MRPKEASPSEEQLRQAWLQLRRGPAWPATLDAALAHPTFGLAVRAVARRMACRAAAPAPTPAPAPARAPAPIAPPPVARPAPQRPRFDAKAAAANDRGDLFDPQE